jgi:transcriptional regulator with XRE-family HTH domain
MNEPQYSQPVSNAKLTSIGQRVKAKREALKLTQQELARLSGLRQSTISNLERDQAGSSRNIAQLAFFLKVNPLWLQTGEGNENSPESNAAEGASENRLIRLEVLPSEGSCGGGGEPLASPDDAYLTLYELQAYGIEASAIKVVIADGLGMAGYIVHGDRAFINTADKALESNAIYAFETATGSAVLKRFLQRRECSVLAMDNADKGRYPDETYPTDAVPSLKIIGRLLCRRG